MKKLLYLLFAFSYNILKIFPVKNQAAFVSMHNAGFTDSLGQVMAQVKKENKYKCVCVTRTDLNIKSFGKVIGFFTVGAYKLATSKYIFLNDNFMPMADMKIRSQTKVIQLWHAEGAFKKFGLDINQPDEIRKREEKVYSKFSFVVCSSQGVVPIYASAFGMKKENVLPLGSPRTDYYFKNNNVEKLREEFEKKYPQCKGKKIILYAPTFRDNPEKNKKLTTMLNIKKFNENVSDEYVLAIRYHPQVHENITDTTGAIDLTMYPNVSELTLIADILITDYSSICMDFSLLDKPCVFYAYDLSEYACDRQFYFDYETYVPGRIVKTQEELEEVFNTKSYLLDTEKNAEFKKFNFDNPDGNAAKRVVNIIFKSEELGMRS